MGDPQTTTDLGRRGTRCLAVAKTGPDGVPARTLQHVWYSAVALLIASVVAVPAGLLIGHTGRGRFLVVNLAGAARAIPSLGLLFIMVLFLGPRLSGDAAFLWPSLVVLIVLTSRPGVYAIRSRATDSRGHIYTTETYEGKRVQRFAYRGVGRVARVQGVPWPRR